jgi:hypothetical protein
MIEALHNSVETLVGSDGPITRGMTNGRRKHSLQKRFDVMIRDGSRAGKYSPLALVQELGKPCDAEY